MIGSFLRAYNDAVDNRRRQDLYAYASRVVGSRASVNVEQARAERLAAWALELGQRRWTRLLLRSRLRLLARNPKTDVVGSSAVRAIAKHSDQTHAQVLALIDQLVTSGAGQQSSPALSGGLIRSAQLTR